MNRRSFLAGMGAFAATHGLRAFAVGTGIASAGDVKIRLGVLSDVHLNKVGDEDTLLAAFRYFDKVGVDGVVIAGDIADTGRREQLLRCGAAWRTVFPGNRGSDGRPVEKLFVYGNHDVQAWTWGVDEKKRADPAYQAACITPDAQAAVWEEAFGEKYEPIWMKTVKGHRFVGVHWPALGAGPVFVAAHAAELRGDTPFFYIQHAHPKDTCFCSWAWGHDDGASTKALSAFPNAVAFSGHSHYSLTDERTVWQGAFTSINTSSLRYTSYDYSLRENAAGNSFGYCGEKRKRTMSTVPTGDGRQGMVLSVCADRMVIERRNFFDNTSLGDDWTVPLPPDGTYAYARRAAGRAAPAFASGAKVSVEVGKEEIKVSFPSAQTVDRCRVNEYEVTATLVEDDVDLVQAQRRILAPGFHLAEEKAPKTAMCVFRCADLPLKGRYRFSVRPIECFGRKGAPIESDCASVGS